MVTTASGDVGSASGVDAAPRLIRRTTSGVGPKARLESPRRQRAGLTDATSTVSASVATRQDSPRSRTYRPVTSSGNVGESTRPAAHVRSVSPRQPVRALSSGNVVSRRAASPHLVARTKVPPASSGNAMKGQEQMQRTPLQRTMSADLLAKRSVPARQGTVAAANIGASISTLGPRGREALVDLSTNERVETSRGRQQVTNLVNRRPRSVSPRLSRMAQYDAITKTPMGQASYSVPDPKSSSVPAKSIGRQLLDQVDMKKQKSGKEMELLRNAVDEYLGKHQGTDAGSALPQPHAAAGVGAMPPPPPPTRQVLSKFPRSDKVLSRRAASVDAVTRRRLGECG